MKTMRWQHCVGLAAAAWLLLASGIMSAGWLGFSMPFGTMVDAVVVAVALAVFATLALALRLSWDGWATLSIGAWALAASAMLRAAHAWMPVLLLGPIALCLCGGLLMSAPPSWRRRDGHRI